MKLTTEIDDEILVLIKQLARVSNKPINLLVEISLLNFLSEVLTNINSIEAIKEVK